MAIVRLDPDEAARNIAARFKTIADCEALILDIAKRYEGFAPFADAAKVAGIDGPLADVKLRKGG